MACTTTQSSVRSASRVCAHLRATQGAGPERSHTASAGTSRAAAHESHKLEKLCRYITRLAISEKRLSISLQVRARLQLKYSWRNGAAQVGWDAVDFIAKLAALVPPPRAHLTRLHGSSFSSAALRAVDAIGGGYKRPATDAAPVDVSANDEPRSPEEARPTMNWTQRPERVLGIDINNVARCGGAVRAVARIEEPAANRAILAHFEKNAAQEEAHCRSIASTQPAAA